MGAVYYLKITSIEYQGQRVKLYIQVTPTGAGDPDYFPLENELKRFFFMALYSVNSFDFISKKMELDLQQPTNSTHRYFVKDMNTMTPFYGVHDDIYAKDDWFEYFDKNAHKFIKKATVYDSSYNQLLNLLKSHDFEEVSSDSVIRKRCSWCKRLFRCENNISEEKMILRAKLVLDTNNQDLIKAYLKEKASMTTHINDVDENMYNWSIQCKEHLYFESPHKVLYFCYSIRCCSTECAINDVKSKTQKQLFDGKDIIHTYGSLLYKVELDKKHVDPNVFEKMKGMMFGSTAF